MSGRFKILLFLFVIVLPGLAAAVTGKVAFSKAQSIQFCSSCHVMTPWIENVTGAESDSLASEHYKRRWIQHDQCYTCHTNYGFLGPIQAKIKGMRHLLAFYIGERGHISLYDEFPNENCLQCHADAKGFLEDSNHEPLEDLLSGKDRCVGCHENLHGVEQEDDGSGDDEAEEEDEAGSDAGEPAAADTEPGGKAGETEGEKP